jgi:hypothetical protein
MEQHSKLLLSIFTADPEAQTKLSVLLLDLPALSTVAM